MTARALNPMKSPTPDHPDLAAQQVAAGEIAVGVIVGRASEYFDFFVYGIASVLVFPSVFFPFFTPLQGQLVSFALLALAFVVRPLGTIAGMVVQRHFGRSTKLTVALLLLGTSTVSIALLPSYDASSAPWAATLLVLCRIGQGLALGASWDGLPSLLALNAPPHRRGWYAMLGQLGAPLGLLVAAGLFAHGLTVLSAEEFLGWGWRYPFFAAFAINVIALFARLRLVVTHEYDQNLRQLELEPCGTSELVREQKGNLLLGAFTPLASYALFHLVTFFPLSWMVLEGTRSAQWVLTVEVGAALVCAAAMPLSGVLADRLGRRRILGILAALTGAWSLVAPLLLSSDGALQDVYLLSGAFLLGLSYGQAAGPVTSNFPARFRYYGAALSTDLAWLCGAAFAPLVVLALAVQIGLYAISLYLLSAVVCTTAALLYNRRLRERGNRRLGKLGGR